MQRCVAISAESYERGRHVEHKGHAVLMAGELVDTVAEGDHQIVQSFQQNVGPRAMPMAGRRT